ncbi:MAG: hypothetical protein WAT12_03485 [Candidatus Nitrotoga sp.]
MGCQGIAAAPTATSTIRSPRHRWLGYCAGCTGRLGTVNDRRWEGTHCGAALWGSQEHLIPLAAPFSGQAVRGQKPSHLHGIVAADETYPDFDFRPGNRPMQGHW